MRTLYVSDVFSLETDEEQVYLRIRDVSLDIFQFNEVLKKYPQVKVTEFKALKDAITQKTTQPVVIGKLSDRVTLEVSADEMSAHVKVNISEEELRADFGRVYAEVIDYIKNNGVTTGIIEDALVDDIPVGKRVLIAKGIQPMQGEDAKYHYYKIGNKTPKVNEDGSSDYYELDLIDNVKVGDWLGEKTCPTKGVGGMTVCGNPIPARSGRDYALKYDRKTVGEFEEGDKIVLRALSDGAVAIKHDRITVENHLHINGNVDYETGNIDFDGSVTIEGTVEDNFKVVATGNIEIKGAQGVGAIDLIESKKGSVVIKGGINGKTRGQIIAKENIYVKFVNEALLSAGREVHIGKYAYDSQVKADKILLDPAKGKIVGGHIQAKHKIISGTIGNVQERETKVHVEGFERGQIMAEHEAIKLKLNDIISAANRLKRKLEIFEQNADALDERAQNTYKALTLQYETLLDEIGGYYRKLKTHEDILRTRGDGEVKVHQKVYPKTLMELKKIQRQITQLMKCSFYVKGNNIHTGE
ncbi:DUF342 domain-containing protein [Fusibacter sp. JL298sf-3]